MDTKYVASWVVADRSPPGEFDPDAVEYGQAVYRSLELAQREAMRLGIKCNVMEWVRVTEETFNPDLDIPKQSDAAWDVGRVWHGDWEGNWIEDRS